MLSIDFAEKRNNIVISPLIDVTYKLHFNAKQFKESLEQIYGCVYGEAGLEMTWQPILGAGVFAMRHESNIWNAWGAELPIVYSQVLSHDALHLAEQTALNKVVYDAGRAAFLDATHNYCLCAGSSYWENDQLVTRESNRLIGIAHLCGLSTYAELYVKARAFYDRGRYLTEEELNSIKALRKIT